MNCISDFETPTTDQTKRMLISFLARKKIHKANRTTVAGNLKGVSRQSKCSRNPPHNEMMNRTFAELATDQTFFIFMRNFWALDTDIY